MVRGDAGGREAAAAAAAVPPGEADLPGSHSVRAAIAAAEAAAVTASSFVLQAAAAWLVSWIR